MTDEKNDMKSKRVIYQIPGMEAVSVERDVSYGKSEGLTMDLYRPPGESGELKRPAVLFVAGFPDPGFQAVMGCRFKDMGSYVSWAELVAASGMVGITYSNCDPVADLERLVTHLSENAGALGIDERRIGVWASSGNVPTALGLLTRSTEVGIKCAALSYGLMFDVDGSTAVAQAAAQIGFANPAADRSVRDLPRDLPLMVTRAGRDAMPGLNDTIDHFVLDALRLNLPLTLVNHASGPHAFDLVDDTDSSREMVKRIVRFLQYHLGA